LVTRDDDTPEALAIRIREYHEHTAPVLRIFERKEYVATIDATESVATVQAVIRTRFGLPPMPT
jgi:adenylate kinase